MNKEHAKTLNALKVAMQMEIDGKEFYLKASKKSTNEMGVKLLQSLAEEEDIHRQKFENIFDSISKEKVWPVIDLKSGEGKEFIETFIKSAGHLKNAKKALDSELRAVQTAMDMESKTYDYYKKQSKLSTFDGEKEFYDALSAQERQHHMMLLDYYEYLKDPSAWFVAKEHPSLDGG